MYTWKSLLPWIRMRPSGFWSWLANAASRLSPGMTINSRTPKRQMRQWVQNGVLGGPPVHMESYHCYELGSDSYAKALLGDRDHWVRRLPGTLMHNNISHGICSIARIPHG